MRWGQPRRAVVVTPHPDDETLALGGTLRQLTASGWGLDLLSVTDGEASHRRLGFEPTALATVRRGELQTALGRLGIGGIKLKRLHLTDSSVRAHINDLTDAAAGILAGAAVCLAPLCHDGHPDHEAAGLAAARACAATGTRLVTYPVWLWHWARPAWAPAPWHRARRIDLSAHDVAAKRHAMDAFASQIRTQRGAGPVLSPGVLAHFRRSYEVVFASGRVPAGAAEPSSWDDPVGMER